MTKANKVVVVDNITVGIEMMKNVGAPTHAPADIQSEHTALIASKETLDFIAMIDCDVTIISDMSLIPVRRRQADMSFIW
jgi:hypothetical protein